MNTIVFKLKILFVKGTNRTLIIFFIDLKHAFEKVFYYIAVFQVEGVFNFIYKNIRKTEKLTQNKTLRFFHVYDVGVST